VKKSSSTSLINHLCGSVPPAWGESLGEGQSCLAKVYTTSQVMHTIHHRQPDCVCGLSAACGYVHMYGEYVGVGEWRIVGELLLSWQGWVLIGTPSEWYECWCHNENSTDGPTLIHSYGELLSPKGLQIRKAFTTLNIHASHSQTESTCLCHRCRYLCSYLWMCVLTLSVCQINSHCLFWYDKLTV